MNNKYLLSLVLIITGIVMFSLAAGFNQQPRNRDSMQIVEQKINRVVIGSQEIKVELADTPAKRVQGLSGREPLAPDQGMLFIFDQPGVYPFWMNKMRFSIDIIWINDGRVVDIWERAPLPDESGIPRYNTQAKALYVLEVNAGLVDKNNIKVGDEVTIDLN